MVFWADEMADQIIETYPNKDEFIIRDEKTISGRVHIGSLRGVVIHAIINQALKERGKSSRFLYEFNDMDPMDGLPSNLDKEKFEPFMGERLKNIPSPDSEHENFVDFYGSEFNGVIQKLGFDVEIIYASDLYDKGTYNDSIKTILNHVPEIIKIYKEVSGSEKAADWIPLQVVCENCKKLGTTKVNSWDGEKATYKCEPNLVKWAEGCGHEGEVVPFDGHAKLAWKTEWGIKWKDIHVDIEGSGKDHTAAGGSHDIAERISKEILNNEPPYNIPYEFFLFGGAKMSSSKGLGASAKEISDILSPELLRFLMVNTWPKKPINFDPRGPTIPRLYDKYDSYAKEYFADPKGTTDAVRAFHYSQIDTDNMEDYFRPRFSMVTFILQMPHLDYLEQIEALKGSPLTEIDKEEALSRKKYGEMWLETYADEKDKFKLQDELPEEAKSLSDGQKAFLGAIADALESNPDLNGEEMHGKIHELKTESGLEPKEAFSAIYLSILGKSSGPQAGWFLQALDTDFVVKRFREV